MIQTDFEFQISLSHLWKSHEGYLVYLLNVADHQLSQEILESREKAQIWSQEKPER